MISWIILIVGIITSILLGYFFCGGIFTFGQILLIFVSALVILLAINGICAAICSKCIPNKAFNKDKKFYTPCKFELKIYEKLGVKKWKDSTFEWGKLNGFSKSKVENPKDPIYIEKFILECNKGFLVHLVSILFALLLFICVPKDLILPMALPMFLTSTLLNVMPIMILRYNVYRLNRVLIFLQRNNKQAN